VSRGLGSKPDENWEGAGRARARYAPRGGGVTNGGELEFVGEDRKRLVDELVVRFKEIDAGGAPHWVSLEALPGWGKSRVAHEFYGRLATDHQTHGMYWPQSILEVEQEWCSDLDGLAVPEYPPLTPIRWSPG
jgi:hypothetical protein